MNILAIDSSTGYLSLAVTKDEEIIVYRNEELGRRMSGTIVSRISRILDQAGITPEKIDGYIVGLGPGSFTSLRVGLSTVKGLAFMENKPVAGIPSFDALACSVKEPDRPVCVVTDAKRSLVYTCNYSSMNDGLKRSSDYLLTDIQSCLDHVAVPSVFIGDGVALYEKEIRKSKKAVDLITDPKSIYPQARYFVREGVRRLKSGKTDPLSKLVPLYLYKEDCQVVKP